MMFLRITPAASLLLVVTLWAVPAAADAPSCSAGAGTLTITGSGAADVLVLAEADDGTFTLNDVACAGGGTSSTIDAIAFAGGAGGDVLAIDLLGLPLFPGATAEPGGSSEIEVAVDGGDGDDTFVLIYEHLGVGIVGGANGLNLNPDDDVDITFTSVEELWVDGAQSNVDVIVSMAGDAVTGAAVSLPTVLISAETRSSWLTGGDGDDMLVGAARTHSSMAGGPGHDVLEIEVPIWLQLKNDSYVQSTKAAPYSTGGALSGLEEAIVVGTGSSLGLWAQYFAGDVTVLGTARADDITTGPGDDYIDGRGGNDLIRAKAGNDVLLGRGGDDLLQGGYGNDRLVGGTGVDRVVESVNGNLTITPASLRGALGTDVLSSIERAFLTGGTGNNSLRGETFRGRLTLRGGGGNDYLAGGYGADSLFGDAGSDRLLGYGSSDTLDGGSASDRCDGGAATDTFLRCETMLGRP